MKTNNVNETLLILAKELIENVTEPITMDENLKNIGFNSLIFVKLVVSIEDTFQFTFDDEMLDYNRYKTLRDISDYIQARI
jgi:acyl carrier protein